MLGDDVPFGQRRPHFGRVRVVTDAGPVEYSVCRVTVSNVLHGVADVEGGGWAELVEVAEPVQVTDTDPEGIALGGFSTVGSFLVGPPDGPVVSIEHQPHEVATPDGHRLVLEPTLVIDDRSPAARTLEQLAEVTSRYRELGDRQRALVAEAHRLGATTREIGAKAGTSHVTIVRWLQEVPTDDR